MPLEFRFISHWTRDIQSSRIGTRHMFSHMFTFQSPDWNLAVTHESVATARGGCLALTEEFGGKTQILHPCCSSPYSTHLTSVGPFHREINCLSNCRIGTVKTKKKKIVFFRSKSSCDQRAALDESLRGGDELLLSQLTSERVSLKTLTNHDLPPGPLLTPPTNKILLAEDDCFN